MFRKILFVLILVVSFGTVIVSTAQQPETVNVKLYFADAGMMRLVPSNAVICRTDTEHEARAVINALIAGRDNNPKIKRLIPDEKKCMSVRVRDNIAIVDIKQKMIDAHPDDKNSEILTVYQIVNSLTSIEDITSVRFTVNGTPQKNFMGHIDMRETFIPDYTV